MFRILYVLFCIVQVTPVRALPECRRNNETSLYLIASLPDKVTKDERIYIRLNKNDKIIERNCSWIDEQKVECLVPSLHLTKYKATFFKSLGNGTLSSEDQQIAKKNLEDFFDVTECVDHTLESLDINMTAEDVINVTWLLREGDKEFVTKVIVTVDGKERFSSMEINRSGHKLLHGFKNCNKHNVCLKRSYYIFVESKIHCKIIETRCHKPAQEKPVFKIVISVIGGLFGVVLIAFFVTCIKYKLKHEQPKRTVTSDQTELLMNNATQPPTIPPGKCRPTLPIQTAEHPYDRRQSVSQN